MIVFPKELLHAQIPTNKGQLLKIYLLKNIGRNNKNNTLIWASGSGKISGTLHSWAHKNRNGVWEVMWVFSSSAVGLELSFSVFDYHANFGESCLCFYCSCLWQTPSLDSPFLCFIASIYSQSASSPLLLMNCSSSCLLLIAFFPYILASAPCHQSVTLYVFNSDSQNPHAGLGSQAQEEAWDLNYTRENFILWDWREKCEKDTSLGLGTGSWE